MVGGRGWAGDSREGWRAREHAWRTLGDAAEHTWGGSQPCLGVGREGRCLGGHEGMGERYIATDGRQNMGIIREIGDNGRFLKFEEFKN